jgi:hypothetical protein
MVGQAPRVCIGGNYSTVRCSRVSTGLETFFDCPPSVGLACEGSDGVATPDPSVVKDQIVALAAAVGFAPPANISQAGFGLDF